MQWRREEYISLLTFGDVGRPMFVELFGPLIGLEDEWRAQGASAGELDLTAFDWDWVPVADCGGTTGPFRAPEPVVLSDTPEYTVSRDYLGRITRLPKGVATIALPQTFPVTDLDSWLRVKPIFAYHPERIDWQQLERAKQLQADGAMVVASIPGGFDVPRELMGEEAACLAYYEQPELMQDIIATLADTSVRVLARVSEHLTIDQLSVHEDMAGKSGPLVGPRQVREWIAPYYRRVWELLSARGTRIFQQDSDGNVNPVIDSFLEAGLTTMFPMEPAAGMDPVAVRQRYGQRLSMLGGIDKHVIRESQEAIRAELEYKMQPLMQQGGMVFGLDHRIPNGTPVSLYRYYVDLGREILGLPPREAGKAGWARMAF